MNYKVTLASIGLHGWIATVEALEPEPRVLLRNKIGNLENCMRAISDVITQHSLSPWAKVVTQP